MFQGEKNQVIMLAAAGGTVRWKQKRVWWVGIEEKIGNRSISGLSDDLSHVFPFSDETKRQTVVDEGLTGGEDAETVCKDDNF